MSNDKNIVFAYWVPNVSGGLVVSNIEQRTDWSYDYNVRLAQTAEQAGFDYALTQIRFTAGYNAENQHESVSFIHGIPPGESTFTKLTDQATGSKGTCPVTNW